MNTKPNKIIHKHWLTLITTVLAVVLSCSIVSCSTPGEDTIYKPSETTTEQTHLSSNNQSSSKASLANNSTSQSISLSDIPAYSGNPVYVVNNNMPFFSSNELHVHDLESYSPLDSLGRCGVAISCVGPETMPTEKRGPIGEVKPSGWVMAKYDCVDGKYLYNRCHLIGFQLAGENANERNLITGTRYMNVDGMLPYENMIAQYIEQTSAHVLYRVTPLFENNNPVATGVLMEARSIEDSGTGICFNVFAYNVQPNIGIDYATGNSWQKVQQSTNKTTESLSQAQTYIINTNTGKFHYPECSSVDKANDQNKKEVYDSRENLITKGYEPCGRCNP